MFTDTIPLFLTNGVVLLILVTALWAVAQLIKDPSIIDSFWAMGFFIVTLISFLVTEQQSFKILTLQKITLLIVGLWAFRLSSYLLIRWQQEGLDKRYAAILSRWQEKTALYSYLYIFLLQGLLILIISAPLQWIMLETNPIEWSPMLAAGLSLFVLGFFFEAVGDWQLKAFKDNPKNKGQVMDRGLWRYSRHPNYFGNALMWWGWYLLASSTDIGAYTIFAPLLMTYLLLKVSGVRLLEKGLKKTKSGYEDYIKRTSPFIPLPPKDK